MNTLRGINNAVDYLSTMFFLMGQTVVNGSEGTEATGPQTRGSHSQLRNASRTHLFQSELNRSLQLEPKSPC